MFNQAFLSVATATLFFASPVAAQDQTIALDSNVLVVKQIDAGTELVEAARVVPGDELEMSTTYTNNTGQTVTDFVLKTPVPSNVTVDDASLTGVEASVDDGSTWGALAELIIRDADGADRQATSADITHVRWILAELAPNQSGSVSYRATVR